MINTNLLQHQKDKTKNDRTPRKDFSFLTHKTQKNKTN